MFATEKADDRLRLLCARCERQRSRSKPCNEIPPPHAGPLAQEKHRKWVDPNQATTTAFAESDSRGTSPAMTVR
jgi:hypothetical protein